MKFKFHFSLLIVALVAVTACDNSVVNGDHCVTQNLPGELSTQEHQLSGDWENLTPNGEFYLVSEMSLNEDRTGNLVWNAYELEDLKNIQSKINIPICSWWIKQGIEHDTLITSFGKANGEAYSPNLDHRVQTTINRESYVHVSRILQVTHPNSLELGTHKWIQMAKK